MDSLLHIDGHAGPSSEDRSQIAADIIGLLQTAAETHCDQETIKCALSVYKKLTTPVAGVEGVCITNSKFTGK